VGLTVATTSSVGISSLVWSVDASSDVDDVFVSRGTGSASAVFGASGSATIFNQNTVGILLSVLTPGYTYTLVLTAIDNDGSSAYSTVDLVMNEAPSSGSLVVTPNDGYALETNFKFSAIEWDDADLPLGYVFGTAGVVAVDDSGNGASVVAAVRPYTGSYAVDTNTLAPFGEKRLDSTLTDVTLSLGPEASNFTLGCFTEVVDAFGAKGRGTATARVRAKVLTAGQLQNVSEAQAQLRIELGDTDASKQVLVATNDQIASVAVTGARRSLLATEVTGVTAPLRASVMGNLVRTYGITSISQEDVSSLLKVLEGVVALPTSEVPREVAIDALDFLELLLNATFSSGVGITATGSDLVGQVLELILATSLFADSEDSSHTLEESASLEAAAVQVEKVVEFLSAAQLTNSNTATGKKDTSSGVCVRARTVYTYFQKTTHLPGRVVQLRQLWVIPFILLPFLFFALFTNPRVCVFFSFSMCVFYFFICSFFKARLSSTPFALPPQASPLAWAAPLREPLPATTRPFPCRSPSLAPASPPPPCRWNNLQKLPPQTTVAAVL
jgi:hypothetical protein